MGIDPNIAAILSGGGTAALIIYMFLNNRETQKRADRYEERQSAREREAVEALSKTSIAIVEISKSVDRLASSVEKLTDYVRDGERGRP